jgi:predicted adenylyl cyclase CyaB
MKEIETRTLVEFESAEKQLLALGFKFEGETFQTDRILDRPTGELFKSGRKIRIRTENGQSELTFKGDFETSGTVANNFTSRRIETNIPLPADDVEDVISFFTMLGYPPLFTLYKTRRKYTNGSVQAVLDDWPIAGWVLELEGEEDKIAVFASKIKAELPFKSYRLKEVLEMISGQTGKSIAELQEEYEKATGRKLGNMCFLL